MITYFLLILDIWAAQFAFRDSVWGKAYNFSGSNWVTIKEVQVTFKPSKLRLAKRDGSGKPIVFLLFLLGLLF